MGNGLEEYEQQILTMQILLVIDNDQSKLVTVDDQDYLECKKYGWYLDESNGYIRKNTQPSWYLHQQILGKAPDGLVIDHFDGNKLNNQRDNLRYVTQLINSQKAVNSRKHLRYIYPNRNTWQVQIRRKTKTYNLGTYNTLEEAIAVRDGFVLKENSNNVLPV